MDQHSAFRLRGDHQGNAHQVGGELGPGSVVNLWHRAADVLTDAQVLLVMHDQDVTLQMHVHTQPVLEDQVDHAHVLGNDAVDADLPACDGAQANKAADLQVVGRDRELAAAQALDTLDCELVAADALDLRAHRVKQAAQVLDMRLGSGVTDDG